MKQEARHWTSHKPPSVQCTLCPHTCSIQPGKRGVCRVRENEHGRLMTLIYGSCSALAEDPIEKKPLFHFHPGSLVFSLGSVGCTFHCEHCQNYHIAMAQPTNMQLRDVPPEEAVQLAIDHGCDGIAFTYNEPTIWHEYALDTAQKAKAADLYTVYVTNGYINKEPLRELSTVLDAMNIDVKAFTDDFYKKICKARLEPVLTTCEYAKKLGIHIELTYLVIPGKNDSADEIRRFCTWILEKLGADTPVHFSRFHPEYHMQQIPPTPIETLKKIYQIAQEIGIRYPYLGNFPAGPYENTICPTCKQILIERHGFSAQLRGLQSGKCTSCNSKLPIVE